MIRACPVCEHTTYRTMYRPKNAPGEVVRCPNCEMVYIAEITQPRALIFEGPVKQKLDPKVFTSTNLDDLPEDYWEFRLLARKLFEYPALRENSKEALQRLNYYGSPGKILDFGCGWGFFLVVARENGWDPYGIEPLPGHALYARAKLGLKVITDTIHPDSYPRNYFDAITSFQVFEHLPDPSNVLNLLWHCQKPHGILQLEVPKFDTWGVRLMGRRHRHYNPDHINFFSKKTITRFLKQHGYQVLETYTPRRYMTLHYLLNFWLRRLIPGRVIDVVLNFRDTQFWEQIVHLNLGDIQGILARKIDH